MSANILIVGENPFLKVALKYHLQRQYHVLETSDGEEALHKLFYSDGKIDIALLETTLKPMGADQLCQQIRKHPKCFHIGVIVVSANQINDDLLAQKLIQTQADYYLSLPIKTSLVLAYVQNCLRVQEQHKAVRSVTALPMSTGSGDTPVMPLAPLDPASADWQKRIMKFLPLPLIVTDLEGNVVQYNTMLEHIFRFRPFGNNVNLLREWQTLGETRLATKLHNILLGHTAFEQYHDYHYHDPMLDNSVVFNIRMVPLRSRAQIEGAIVVLENVSRQYKSMKRLRRAYKETQKIMGISNMLVETRDFKKVVDSIFKALQQLFPFEGINVLLEDQNVEKLVSFRLLLPETLNISPTERKELVSLSYSSKILDVFETQNLSHLYTPNVDPSRFTDPRFKRAYDLAPIRSNLLVPLGQQGNYFGMLFCSTYDKVLHLTEEDIFLVKRYVNQLSIALKNAKLYEELAQEKERVSRTYRDLSEAKRFTDSILKHASVGIFTLNRKGVLTSVNPALRKMFGCTEKDLRIGANYDRVVMEYEPVEGEMRNTALRGTTCERYNQPYVFPLTQKDMVLDMTVTPLMHGGSVEGTLHVYQDVTVRAHAEAALAEAHMRLQKEIDDTAMVQRILLPSVQPSHPHFDIYGDVIPAEQCSGDWWSYIDYQEDGILIAVGDVTGHGVPSAMVTAITDGVFTFYRLAKQLVSPDEMLQSLNDVIMNCVRGGYNMTVWFGWFQSATNTLLYANAGHNFPFHIQGGKIKELPSRGYILGRALAHEREWELRKVHYTPGDWFLIYTDGIIENENKENEEYSKRRLRRLIKKISTANSAPQVWQDVVNDVNKFLGSQSYGDDMSLVVVKTR